MKFSMIHENYNVSDLARSLEFYRQALGLEEVRRKEAADGSFIIVYVAVPGEPFELELTWLRDHPQKYDLSVNPGRSRESSTAPQKPPQKAAPPCTAPSSFLSPFAVPALILPCFLEKTAHSVAAVFLFAYHGLTKGVVSCEQSNRERGFLSGRAGAARFLRLF